MATITSPPMALLWFIVSLPWYQIQLNTYFFFRYHTHEYSHTVLAEPALSLGLALILNGVCNDVTLKRNASYHSILLRCTVPTA